MKYVRGTYCYLEPEKMRKRCNMLNAHCAANMSLYYRDIHYRSLTLRSGVKKSLMWDEKSVDQIVHKIQSINFDEEPGADEP